MTEIQKFLRAGGTFEELEAKYAIGAKRHLDYPNLVLFKYDQIDSPFSEPIVRECRGIILDEEDDWRIVSRAFDKFFNYGEGHAAQIDWDSATVMEKLDGSLAVVYPYKGEWHVATSGTPDARGDVHGFGVTFKELFWQTFPKDRLPPIGNHCFFFELTGPINRIVVRYEQAEVRLLGARNLDTQEEIGILKCLDQFAWPGEVMIAPVPFGPNLNLDWCLKKFDEIDPLEQEGWVVVDKHFNRVKIKHPGYVALHHLKGSIDGPSSNKNIYEIARQGEIEEVIATFPEFRDRLETAKRKFDELCREMDEHFDRLRNIESQKDFALEAVKTPCSGCLFALRRGQYPAARAYFKEMRIENLKDLLERAS